MTNKSNKVYRTIGEVVKLLGLKSKKGRSLPTHTIRFWEKEFKQIKPKILDGNRRYYDQKNILLLKKIHFLLKEQGMTIDGVKKILKKNETLNLDVIKNDSIIQEEYFLGYNESSMTNSFSMSKSIISFLLFKSIESKTIKSLDEKLIKYYPEFESVGGDNVTLGDLASMSSGLKWEENYKNLLGITARSYVSKDLKRLMLKSFFIDLPGKSFDYQSGSTQLLSMVIEKANNKKINDLVSEWLWDPIGAENDALWMVDSKENNELKTYCCLNSNARDFSKVGKLYKDNGIINGIQVMNSSNITKSISPRFENNPIYGYGFWIGKFQNQKFFSMRGHQGQYVIVFPKINLIITRLGKRKAKGQSLNGFPKDFTKYISESFKILKANNLINE